MAFLNNEWKILDDNFDFHSALLISPHVLGLAITDLQLELAIRGHGHSQTRGVLETKYAPQSLLHGMVRDASVR